MTLLQHPLNWSDDIVTAPFELKWWHCYSAFWTEVMALLQRPLSWSDGIVTAPFELKWWYYYNAVWTEVMILLQRFLNWSDDIVTEPFELKWWHCYSMEQSDAACCRVLAGTVQTSTVTDHLKVVVMTDLNDRFLSPLIPSASKVMER